MSTEFSTLTDANSEYALACVQGCISATLHATGEIGVLHADMAGMAITFEDQHELLDDMGIAFSRYPVCISFAGKDADECRRYAIKCARTLRQRGLGSAIVVRDCQELIASS